MTSKLSTMPMLPVASIVQNRIYRTRGEIQVHATPSHKGHVICTLDPGSQVYGIAEVSGELLFGQGMWVQRREGGYVWRHNLEHLS